MQFKRAFVTQATLACLICACSVEDAESVEIPTTSPTVTSIPADFQGRWSASAESCPPETWVTGDWFYVGEYAIGSFEHMYATSDVQLNAEGLHFETGLGGPSGRLKLQGAERMTLTSSHRDPVDLLLCSKELVN